MNPTKNVCIFCGANSGNSPVILAQAKELALLLAGEGYHLIYGGGHEGLMGLLADEFLQAGKQVIGIRPEKLIKDESAHPGITEMVEVKDMYERKDKLIEAADLFIALPGGIGTLDELIEVFTQTKIGFIDKTFAILNTEGFYVDLIKMLDKMVRFGFLREADRALLIVGDNPIDLMEKVSN